MDIVRDDIRRFLRASARGYDVIVGDVFHPDLAGRSTLLSVQQFELARARLNKDGVFVQWLALNQFDLESLRIVLRSFRQVFPESALFMDGFRLALVGFEAGFDPAARLDAVRARLPAAEDAVTGGEGFWTWLGRYWGRIPATDGPLQDEWRPVLEFRLPYARYHSTPDLAQLLDWLLAQRPEVRVAAQELGITETDYPALERSYIAADLGLRSWLAALRGADAEAIRLIRYAYQANPRDRWVSYSLADDMYASLAQSSAVGPERRRALLAILAVRPDHGEALRALWQLEQAAGDEAAAKAYLARLAAVSPFDRDVAQAGK
jgi:spermidine synthase